MTSLTLPIPEQIKQKMKKFKHVNWAEVIRSAILDKMQILEEMNQMLSASTLTDEETMTYGRLLKKRQWLKTKKIFTAA